MRIDNEFTVQAPIERVWGYLLDVEKVAPCMPGAELTEVVDDHTWKGKTNIKVGPVALSFAGTVVMQERDDAGHRVVLNAQGMEQKGKGAASAVVVSRLETVEGGTKVALGADLTISGAVAQYGRGMISDISQRLTNEFARCLEASINAQSAAAPSSIDDASSAPGDRGSPDSAPASAVGGQPAAVARPVKGFRLGLSTA